MTLAHWSWTDFGSPLTQRGRWYIFARSGEALTAMLLTVYAVIFLLPGSTLTTSASWAWLINLSHQRSEPWAVMAFALSVTGPLAVGMDEGRLRVLSLASQGVFFVLLGISVFQAVPRGLGWSTFMLAGLWLLWRAGTLVRYHTTRGE
jgi:hypothetical protein